MKDREQRIEWKRGYCRHYKPQPGIGKCDCALGCKPEKVETVGPTGSKLKWGPCIGGHTLEDPTAACPKWERHTREEAEAYADHVEASLNKMILAAPVISAWRKKEPFGKREVIECPVCKNRLHLQQSSYNGHVRAQCETKDCIAFIE